MKLRSIIKQNSVASFIIATLLLSFAICLVPVPKESAFTIIAFMLIPIPTVVAFTLTAIIEGRRGVHAFLGKIFRTRTAFKWVLIAFVLGFVVHFGSSLLALITGGISSIGVTAPTAFFIAVFPLALPEEIGWRGFALRRLLDRHSLFVAMLITGIPWALIHFVLFAYLAPGTSPVAEMLTVLSFALPLTWIYVRSGQNVLVATVLHGAMNAFGIVAVSIPIAEQLWFLLASASIVGAALLVYERRMWFAKPMDTRVNQDVRAGVSLAN
jgi:membrane protease YdiL (CAAX protease family)